MRRRDGGSGIHVFDKWGGDVLGNDPMVWDKLERIGVGSALCLNKDCAHAAADTGDAWSRALVLSGSWSCSGGDNR